MKAQDAGAKPIGAWDHRILLMLGYLCISTEGPEASLVRKVEILDRFSLAVKEIAKICKCSEQSVKNARLLAKHSPRRRK